MIKTSSMECTNKVSLIGKNGESLFWSFSENGFLTVEGMGGMPDYHDKTTPWEEVKQDIKSVVIKNGITRVGSQAFKGCGKLVSVDLPKSLKMIHFGAFEDCCSLKEVHIPADMKFRHIYEENNEIRKTISMGSRVFRNTPWASEKWGDFLVKKNVLIEYYGNKTDVVLPENIQEIGTNAFRGIPLTSIILNQGIKKIGFGAFGKTGLTRIVLPESVEEVDENAFQNVGNTIYVEFESDNAQFAEGAFDNSNIIFSGHTGSSARQYALVNKVKFYDIDPAEKPLSDYVREIPLERLDDLGCYLEKMLKAGHVVYKVILDENCEKAEQIEVFAGRRKTADSVPRSIETFAGGDDKIFCYTKWNVEEISAEKEEERILQCKEDDKYRVKLLPWNTDTFWVWFHEEYLKEKISEERCIWYISRSELAEEQIGEFRFLEMWIKEDFLEKHLQAKRAAAEKKERKKNRKITESVLRAEALRRIRYLKLSEHVQKDFKENHKLYISDSVFLCSLTQEENDMIKKWEERTGNMVYHAIRNDSQIGELFTMLYVSRDADNWQNDRKELKSGFPMAYCINLSCRSCSEYGYIEIEPCCGIVLRTA